MTVLGGGRRWGTGLCWIQFGQNCHNGRGGGVAQTGPPARGMHWDGAAGAVHTLDVLLDVWLAPEGLAARRAEVEVDVAAEERQAREGSAGADVTQPLVHLGGARQRQNIGRARPASCPHPFGRVVIHLRKPCEVAEGAGGPKASGTGVFTG